MAEQKVKVVAPMNMGKGLLWDEATGTYYVALNDNQFIIDDLGNIKLRLSALEDNQLQERPDGIYIGNTAKEELRDLYIANHGNDSNPGTREQPLQTIDEAIKRLENVPAHYHIWLHEGHTFEWTYQGRQRARLLFDAYGPLIDSTYPMSFPSNYYYRGYTAKNFPRPTVNVRARRLDNRKLVRRDAIICEEAMARGIKFDIYDKVDNDNASYSGSFTGLFDCTGKVTLHGCIVEVKTKGVSLQGPGAYRGDVLFRGNQILWIDSLIEGEVPLLAASSYTAQFSLASWNHDHLHGLGEYPDHEALIKNATAFQDMGRGMKDAFAGVFKDEATKQWRGIEVNWDIFST